MNMTPAAVRVRLKEILNERGITQAEFAKMSGVRPMTVSAIVNGASPQLETIQRICTVLNIQPGDLIVLEDSEQ